ncbi:MAG: large-conductance mechanosensitive channel protein MscL [Planctomycetota bacterium]
MGIIKEFKEFIIKGNMIDMAVGIIIGAAFGLVVKSFVADIIMPPIGAAMGGIDFADLKYPLVDAVAEGEEHPVTGIEVAKDIPAVTLNYGLFINACIALLIQGIAIFILIKMINKMKRKEEEAPKEDPKPSEDVVLLGEIRDLLAKQGG